MLNNGTKRHIDNARDILVGKVPDPKAQVEQITNALIHKFMSDMDQQSILMGGKAGFFVGEYEQYAWQKILDVRLSGQARMDLYIRALENMWRNPELPPLFSEILNGAYLPYRDPQTLTLFLKEIDEFKYEHSEDLGDAYEYLLSVLGSQGAAGQFRTPRHIIDFMVAVVDPQKNERILDPACGTAGFLISAYKHILERNEEKGLTPSENEWLMNNIVGYDISPDMVKLSRVNMYLHQFQNPKIQEYDTLTSEEHWDDEFDVIMANPPFMTPRGGIIPHQRFMIQAKRSEVLFVDYIVEHLSSTGRAAIIVPEGIIFRTDNAYKQLRKMLVEDGLYAVVSLPAGVFNPYSGVKTSILFFDNQFAKEVEEILFIKIENDGYDLGAQRHDINENDLPLALEILWNWKKGGKIDNEFLLWIEKEKIGEDEDFILTSERYKESIDYRNRKWPSSNLGEICDIVNGSTPLRSNLEYWEDGTIPWFTIDDIREQGRKIRYTKQKITQKGLDCTSLRLVPPKTILLCCTASVGEYAITEIPLTTNQQFNGLIIKDKNKDKIIPEFLFYLSSTFKKELIRSSGKTSFNYVSVRNLKRISIPLPPLEVQQDIVAQIEVKQAVIDGAKQVIANLEKERRYFGRELQKMDDVEWVELGEVCEINSESECPQIRFREGDFIYIDISSVENGTGRVNINNKVEVEKAPSRARRVVQNGDVIISTVRPNLRAFALLSEIPNRTIASTGFAVLRAKEGLIPKYLYEIINSDFCVHQMERRMGKGSYPSINQKDVKELEIPLPSLLVQKNLIKGIERKDQIIETNLLLIEEMEKRIGRILDDI